MDKQASFLGNPVYEQVRQGILGVQYKTNSIIRGKTLLFSLLYQVELVREDILHVLVPKCRRDIMNMLRIRSWECIHCVAVTSTLQILEVKTESKVVGKNTLYTFFLKKNFLSDNLLSHLIMIMYLELKQCSQRF